MSYSGFFMRDELGQQPGQTGSSFDSSPDIVLTQNLTAPYQFITGDDYNTDHGSAILIGAPNFVYPRALASQIADQPGQIWLFWTPAEVLLFPWVWRSDQISVGGQAVNYQPIVAGAAGQPCTIQTPFEWTPTPYPPLTAAYFVIAFINNPGVTGDPRDQIYGPIEDMQALVNMMPYLAMRRCSTLGNRADTVDGQAVGQRQTDLRTQ